MDKRKSRKNFRIRLEEMIQSLRNEIVSGNIPSDSFLPSESDLEIQYELSNNSVRKGLEALVAEGLIEKIPRVGNRVKGLPSDKRTVLRFAYVRSVGAIVQMDRLLAQFRRQFPLIEVQAIELPSISYSRTLMEYMKAGLVDVALINNNNYQDFVESAHTDLLEPITVNEELYPFLTRPFQSGTDTLLQPFVFSPVMLCYNKTHFGEAGVPEPDSSWTWQDLMKYGRQLAIPEERFGFYFYVPSHNRWPVFMLQSGCVFEPKANGEYRLQDSQAIDGLEVCRELLGMSDVFPSILSESDADAEALFLNEKVSVIMTTYFFLNQLKDSQLSFDVSPLPGLHNSNTLLLISGLAVNRRSQHKESAKLLVQYLTSYEAQLSIRCQTLNIAAHRQAMEWKGEEAVHRPSRYFMYREIIPTFKRVTELGLSNRQLKEMKREIMLFLSGLQARDALSERLERFLSSSE